MKTVFKKLFNTKQINALTYKRGADKSLARQETEQATAAELGIYVAHSQRSSVHFLARCS
jgi:hypothetical protein